MGPTLDFCLSPLVTLLPLQEEKEKRRLEQLERKKETQRLLEEEDSRLKGGKAPRVAPAKVTRAQIEDSLRKEQRAEPGVHVAQGRLPTPTLGPRPLQCSHILSLSPPVEKAKSHLELPLEENLNRRLQEEGSVEARTVEDAIAVLRWAGRDCGRGLRRAACWGRCLGPGSDSLAYSVAEEADRHPERRMRAAFTAFEEVHLPRLKQENPNMRLSQLKQLLKKEWLRSPDNPMNQRALPFNAPK